MQALPVQRIFYSAAVALLATTQPTMAGLAGNTSDRHIELPRECDIIQLKAMESFGYLGIGSSTAGNAGEAVSADHAYHSIATHFQVKYDTLASGWMALSVPSHGEASFSKGKKRSYLSFDHGGRPIMREIFNVPRNISFVLSGWPVIRDSTRRVIFAGPYYRLHLVDVNQQDRRIATVGANRAGRVTLYPAEDATLEQGESFANPPTLFLLSVLSSPGPNCEHLDWRNSQLQSSSARDAGSFDEGSQQQPRRRATETSRSSAKHSILVNRLFSASRQLYQ